jgi:hypothetical protein
VNRHARLLLLIAVCVSCKPAQQQQPAKPTSAGPQVRATVVAVRTTVEPEKKTYEHTLVIAGNRVRNTGEHDVWRLYDLKASTVTFVDDVEKTIRTEPLGEIVGKRRTTNAAALPAHFRPALIARGGQEKPLHGATARQVVIASGGYRRELWMAEHPSIPRGLFAMMYASDNPSSPLAPMMRDVDQALFGERGFPLVDRTEVPVGNTKLIVERAVTGFTQRQVPESLLALPKGYKDLTPKPASKQ